MGGSSKTTTENKPPAWAEPLFKQSADQAGALYNSGAGGNTYTGSTVADLSPTTMSGVNQLAQAGSNWQTNATRPLYQGLGAAAVSNPAIDSLYGVAGQAGAPTAAETYLTDTASGAYLNGEGNPFYRERLDKNIADANAMIRSQFSGMGRTGSGAEQRTVADSTSNMLLGGLESDWNRERENQMRAVGMLDDSKLAALGLEGNLIGNAGGLYSTGIGQGLGAAGAMSDQDQQQFQNQLAGADATLKAGGILDDQAQKQLSDDVAKWYSLDNQDWTRLGLLQSAASGAAGPYGVQQSRTSSSNPLGVLSAVGGMFGGK